MKSKKEKGHWVKRVETFDSGADARNRAETLRTHKDIAHVKMSKDGERYSVRYSIAKAYLHQLQEAGIHL